MLDSRHVYVVVRQHAGRWIAALGIGGFTEQVRRADADPERARKASPEHRAQHRGSRRRGGGSSWATREEAVAAGVAAWRAAVAAAVAAEGGCVEPRAEPIVLFPAHGQSAWDLVD